MSKASVLMDLLFYQGRQRRNELTNGKHDNVSNGFQNYKENKGGQQNRKITGKCSILGIVIRKLEVICSKICKAVSHVKIQGNLLQAEWTQRMNSLNRDENKTGHLMKKKKKKTQQLGSSETSYKNDVGKVGRGQMVQCSVGFWKRFDCIPEVMGSNRKVLGRRVQ